MIYLCVIMYNLTYMDSELYFLSVNKYFGKCILYLFLHFLKIDICSKVSIAIACI